MERMAEKEIGQALPPVPLDTFQKVPSLLVSTAPKYSLQDECGKLSLALLSYRPLEKTSARTNALVFFIHLLLHSGHDRAISSLDRSHD